MHRGNYIPSEWNSITHNTLDFYRPRSRGDNMLEVSVHLSTLSRLNRLTFDFAFWHGTWPWLGWECRYWSKVRQRSRSNSEETCFYVRFWNLFTRYKGQGQLPRSRSFPRSKVKVKVWGHGQMFGTEWAIPTKHKSKSIYHYASMVFVFVISFLEICALSVDYAFD